MISAQDLNVKLSMPMIFKISCWVSFALSFEQSFHSPSMRHAMFSVTFPERALVLVTRYFFSPIRNVNIMAPDRTDSSFRSQGDLPVSSLMMPSLGCS